MKQERILVDEGLTLYIKEGDKVRKIVVKKPRCEWTLWDHFKSLFCKKGTLTNFGKDQAAMLFLNLSGAYYVDSIGAKYGPLDTDVDWKGPDQTTREYVGIGTVKIHNSQYPWSGGKNYNAIRCRSSLFTSSWHNSIDISLDLSGASNVSFWAEVKFIFS